MSPEPAGGAAAPEPPTPTPVPTPALDVVQSWFHAVVTHPGGVAAGAASPTAQSLVRLDRDALEAMVRRSSRLTAEERLSIYANAYYARLLECLGDGFPLLKRVLGAETFDGFAFDYLQRYPSRSYTLDRLAEHFPRFLAETRPEPSAATPDWADFLIDLATFEWSLAKVFDGPGIEGEPLLAPEDLAHLGSGNRFADTRLTPVPCLRLLTLRFPLNAFYTAARTTDDPDLPFPDPAPEWVALTRTDFVVRRHTLTAFEHALLAALADRAAVAAAIAAALPDATPAALSDADLAHAIDAAFRRFTAAGFFRRVAP